MRSMRILMSVWHFETCQALDNRRKLVCPSSFGIHPFCRKQLARSCTDDGTNLGRNTLLCRMIHQNMAPFRPAVHFPHTGKTGGGFCVDHQNYITTVTEDCFVNAPYEPFGGRKVKGRDISMYD